MESRDGSGSEPRLNGCADANFVAGTTVAFGGAQGLAYSPKCLKIAAGASVTFNGDFSTHPLLKGTPGNQTAGSAGNPIVATVENVFSVVLSLLAILLPILAAVLVVVAFVWVGRMIARLRRRREQAAPEPIETSA